MNTAFQAFRTRGVVVVSYRVVNAPFVNYLVGLSAGIPLLESNKLEMSAVTLGWTSVPESFPVPVEGEPRNAYQIKGYINGGPAGPADGLKS